MRRRLAAPEREHAIAVARLKGTKDADSNISARACPLELFYRRCPSAIKCTAPRTQHTARGFGRADRAPLCTTDCCSSSRLSRKFAPGAVAKNDALRG